MANVFQKALFRTPKYNVFPQPSEFKGSFDYADLIPVQYWHLEPGMSILSKMSQITRYAPLLSPIFQKNKIDFHAFCVPDRLAIPMQVGTYDGYFDGFESFHNLAISDEDRPQMPQTTMAEYIAYLKITGMNPIGTLFDYLQYPCFENLYSGFLVAPELKGIFEVNDYSLVKDSDSNKYITRVIGEVTMFDNTSSEYTVDLADVGVYISPMLGYLALLNANSPNITADKAGMLTYLERGSAVITPYSLWDSSTGVINYTMVQHVIESNFDNATQFYNDWKDVVYTYVLQYLFPESMENNQQPISLLPIYAYWSVIYDWYINTNLEQNSEKKDKWLHEVIGLNFAPQINSIPLSGFNENSWLLKVDGDEIAPTFAIPFKRYWSNDYFTSAFLSPQAGNAVSIPVNGTIADLRNANSLQEFMEKLIYSGKRAIDVVKTIFGVSSSDERLDRTQVIGSASFYVNFAEVLQTSQSDFESNLGQYAGQGISVGKDRFIDFQVQEHSTIIVFASVRPNAIYQQQMNHLLLQTDPYDFLIPDFSQVGEQPILADELFPQSEQGKIFGYTRRYAQYMFTPSHIAGEFRTSLNYWHQSRIFDTEPVLNTEFAKVTDKDDLKRIFAVPDAKEHLYSYVHFDTYITAPLSKFVQYSL